MRNLQPYHNSAPLTAGARFIRGFSRIGAVCAVLVAMSGIAVSYFSAKEDYERQATQFKNANCVARVAGTGYAFKPLSYNRNAMDYRVAGCGDLYLYEKPVAEVIALAKGPAPSFFLNGESFGTGLLVTGVCGVGIYLVFWLLGWLCSGFTRDA